MIRPSYSLDTNILVYAEGLNGIERQRQAFEILARLSRPDLLLPTQVLGEFFHVLTRKFALPADIARDKVADWSRQIALQAATASTFAEAFTLAATHRLQIWDALIIATAAEASCAALLSEDLQHGAVYLGVTVINPFAEPVHPLLADALR